MTCVLAVWGEAGEGAMAGAGGGHGGACGCARALAVAAGARAEAVRQMDATLRALGLLEAAAGGLGRARAAEAALARVAGELEAAVAAMDWPGCSPTRLGSSRGADGSGGAEAHPDEARIVGMVRALAEVREACELESCTLRQALDLNAATCGEVRIRAESLEKRAAQAEGHARVCEDALAEGLERQSAAESRTAQLEAELEEARRPGPATRDVGSDAPRAPLTREVGVGAGLDAERLAELEASVTERESELRAGREREAGLALAAQAARSEREAATVAERRAQVLAARCQELEREVAELRGVPNSPRRLKAAGTNARRHSTGSPAGAPLRAVQNVVHNAPDFNSQYASAVR